MTRTRKPVGRIAFVGAGPGDPGLLTRRAHDALVDADQVVFDRGVPESLLDIRVRPRRRTGRAGAEAKEDAQFTPAEGAPGDVAKVLISAARSGLRAVHLVAGDPFGHDSVVKEVQAVARTAVPFEVVPGVGQAEGVASYAGVPLPRGTDRRGRRRRRHAGLRGARRRRLRRGLALAVDAGDLAAVRDGLLAAGVDGTTAGGGDRRRHR